MGKATTNTVLDTALALLKSSADAVNVCTSEPTTYAEATSTYNLATGAITSADWTGPADSSAGGRKVTFDGKGSLSVTSSGTAAHVAWTKASGSLLYCITTCSSQVLTSGNSVTVPGSIVIAIDDPT